MGMKTKLKIAGLDQSEGAGLLACLHNSADGKSCMHIIKICAAAYNSFPLLQVPQRAIRGSLNPNGSAHTFKYVGSETYDVKVLKKNCMHGKGRK